MHQDNHRGIRFCFANARIGNQNRQRKKQTILIFADTLVRVHEDDPCFLRTILIRGPGPGPSASNATALVNDAQSQSVSCLKI